MLWPNWIETVYDIGYLYEPLLQSSNAVDDSLIVLSIRLLVTIITYQLLKNLSQCLGLRLFNG